MACRTSGFVQLVDDEPVAGHGCGGSASRRASRGARQSPRTASARRVRRFLLPTEQPITNGPGWRCSLGSRATPFARWPEAIGPLPLSALGGCNLGGSWRSSSESRTARTFWLLSIRLARAHVASGAGRGVVTPCRVGWAVPPSCQLAGHEKNKQKSITDLTGHTGVGQRRRRVRLWKRELEEQALSSQAGQGEASCGQARGAFWT
jgi:hypothetical protein